MSRDRALWVLPVSLIAALLLGLLPRRLRSRRHAVGLDEARHAAAHELQTEPYGRDSRVTI